MHCLGPRKTNTLLPLPLYTGHRAQGCRGSGGGGPPRFPEAQERRSVCLPSGVSPASLVLTATLAGASPGSGAGDSNRNGGRTM